MRLAWLLVAAGLLMADNAHGQSAPGATATTGVTLGREPPFDRWCVAPLCQGGASPAHGPLLTPPALIEPNSSQGYLEFRAKTALADALDAAARAALGDAYNEAVADLAEAIAATATGNEDRLTKAGGLGSAVLRAGLTYHLTTVVPAQPGCEGPRRLDAIYEGLGVSVVLAPLAFPRRRGTVSASCVDTARAAARAVDQAVLDVLTTPELRASAVATAHVLQDARQKCGVVPGAAGTTVQQNPVAGNALGASTVTGLAHALRSLKASTPSAVAPPATDGSAPSADAQTCTVAIEALRTLDPAPLEALVTTGMGDADIAAVAVQLDAPINASMSLVSRLATGPPSVDDLKTLVATLAREANLPVDAPVLSRIVGALEGAVVVKDGSATIDPGAIPWSLFGVSPSPWIVELNGGVPNVDFSQQKVVADMTFGYASKRMGLVGRGWIDTYTLDNSQTHDDYTHAGGSLEGWWLSGEPTSDLRLELRVAGEFDYYDTTSYPLVNSLNNFYDFDSRMGRGNLLVGLRYGQPGDRMTLQALVGGGGQYEDPDTTRFNGTNTLSLVSDANFTVEGTGRLLVRVRVVPGFFGVRLRGESTYFSITREQLLVASTGGGPLTTTSSVEQQQQLEVHGRLFLDADVASFGGFVPALFGGLDYLNIQGGSTGTSTVIPSLGIGIVRQAP